MNHMSTTVNSWINFLNTQDDTAAASFLDEALTVLAYQEGSEGPVTRLDGLAQVVAWVQYPPKGSFLFRLTSLDEGAQCPDLPAADTTLHGTYEVSHTTSDFTNQGTWKFAIQDERILGILHVPNTI